MPLELTPKHYPADGKPLVGKPPAGGHRGAERGWSTLLSHALLRALWGGRADTADPKVRIAVANENGLPGEALLKEELSEQVQQLYKAYSEEAERLGVFGAPTYVLEGERFWGQDRLEFLDRALAVLPR